MSEEKVPSLSLVFKVCPYTVKCLQRHGKAASFFLFFIFARGKHEIKPSACREAECRWRNQDDEIRRKKDLQQEEYERVAGECRANCCVFLHAGAEARSRPPVIRAKNKPGEELRGFLPSIFLHLSLLCLPLQVCAERGVVVQCLQVEIMTQKVTRCSDNEMTASYPVRQQIDVEKKKTPLDPCAHHPSVTLNPDSLASSFSRLYFVCVQKASSRCHNLQK